jgi:perosamine synthetase
MSSNGSAAFIPLCVPQISGNEWVYVKECLDTNWVSSVGPFVDRFETDFARAVGASHAVACQSGTAALHVALQVAGVGLGDEVLVPTLTFVAPANAACYLGATPVLVDAEPEHWGIDLRLVEDFLRHQCECRDGRTVNRATGCRVAAIVPVHVLGHPVDMDWLMTLAEEFGLAVIEDATESLGATYRGRQSGTIGHLGCFSFNGNKILTTGGGGMIVTERADFAHRAKHLSNQAKVDPVEYEHDEIGYNYRLTNIQAAIGVAQLERLACHLAAKRAIARRYSEAFATIDGLASMRQSGGIEGTWWLFTVLVDAVRFGTDSRELMRKLAEYRIQSRPLWRPLHKGLPHEGRQLLGGAVAESLYATALSLPSSVGLALNDQLRVIDTIRDLAAR